MQHLDHFLLDHINCQFLPLISSLVVVGGGVGANVASVVAAVAPTGTCAATPSTAAVIMFLRLLIYGNDSEGCQNK